MDPYFGADQGLHPPVIAPYSPIVEDSSAFGFLIQRIAQIERALDLADRKKNRRDKLAQQLHNMEDKIDEALFERRNRSKIVDPEDLSLQDRLETFLNWRDQLQIFYSAIERSIQLMRRQRAPKREIKRLQEIKDETLVHVCQSDWLSPRAREKLDELKNDNDLAAHSLQRSKNRKRDSKNASSADSNANYNANGGAATRAHDSFHEILDEAERFRAISEETSLRMENEVETLKAEGRCLAEEIVDLHKVLESLKQQLVDVTRMKRENEKQRKFNF